MKRIILAGVAFVLIGGFAGAYYQATQSMTINVTLPSGTASALLVDLSNALGYEPTIDDGMGNQIPNPVTRQNWVKQETVNWWIERIRHERADQAAVAAREAQLAADLGIVLVP